MQYENQEINKLTPKDYEAIIEVLLNKIRQLQWYIENIQERPLPPLRDLKPFSEISRLKQFMDVFNRETKNGQIEISKDDLLSSLLYDIYFVGGSEEVIKKAMVNGQIYENRTGYYKKA